MNIPPAFVTVPVPLPATIISRLAHAIPIRRCLTSAAAPVIPPLSTRVTVNPNRWRFNCIAGYWGESTHAVGALDTCVVSIPAPTCQKCGYPIAGNTSIVQGGFYCPGGTNASRVRCPIGRYGANTALTLTSSTCSGLTAAGYFNNMTGQSSPFVWPCGGPMQYCPAGSTAPKTIPNPTTSYYTTPLTVSTLLRRSYAACPTNYQCAGGLIKDGVQFGGCGTVPVGSPLQYRTVMTIPEDAVDTEYGIVLTATAPGCSSCAITWSYNITLYDGNCTAARNQTLVLQTVTASNPSVVRARIGRPGIDLAKCGAGFRLTFIARRTATPTKDIAACNAEVTLAQVARTPNITDCRAREVAEKQPPGAIVGPPMKAVTQNFGTSLTWRIFDTTNVMQTYFNVDLCSGQIRTAAPILWSNNKFFRVVMEVSNEGISPVLKSYCTTNVSIIRVNTPPYVITEYFLIVRHAAMRLSYLVSRFGALPRCGFPAFCPAPVTTLCHRPIHLPRSSPILQEEGAPIGTFVGQLEGFDDDLDRLGGYRWIKTDTPDHFAVNSAGIVSVKGFTDVLAKSVYRYTYNFTDGYIFVSQSVNM